MAYEILIVDDEATIRSSFSALLRDRKYRTDEAPSAEIAIRKCEQRSYSLILLDLQLPGMSGLEFLEKVRALPERPEVLVISGQADIPMALQAIKLGAVDFLDKPVGPEKLLASVHSALLLADARQQRALMLESVESSSQIVGRSAAVRKLLQIIDKVAPTDSTVLITGPNGTGKELVATRVYLESKRRDKPFVRVNCPGIPDTLFESELFGHLKGAFTGAVRNYPGKFVLADGGTIFLDEIGELPFNLQAKLLRVLESGEVETLGSEARNQVNVRVICATNRSLEQLVREGRFREDLYYRISVFVIDVPPLNTRRDDVPMLIGAFLARFDPAGRTQLSTEAIAWLTTLDYPGNVRQLKNIVERLTILSRDRTVQLAELQEQLGSAGATSRSSTGGGSLSERLAEYERAMIAQTLSQCKGNISEAARLLQMDRAAVSRKIKELGLK